MKLWARGCCVLLAVLAAGCGGGETITPTLTVTLSPASVTVLVGSFVQFLATPSSSVDSATFTVNGVEGGNATVGTIDSGGLYQAPAVVPVSTVITVEITVANSQTSTSASDTTTVTLDSGVRVSIVPAKFIIGTGEEYAFCARVSGVPSNPATSGDCNSTPGTPVAVTWSVTGSGSIDSSTGNYTAPSTTGTATITATSVYDTARTATATVTIVTAADPTLTLISNTQGAVGAVHQDIYLAGTNFISTTNIFLNGVAVDPTTTNIALVSPTVLRMRLAPSDLTTAGTFTFAVAQKGPVGGPAGAQQLCSNPDPAQCQLVLSAVRPAIVGTSRASVAQGSPAFSFNVNGGYFGTAVDAEFGGSTRSVSPTLNATRQLEVTIDAADSNTPGLFPVAIRNSSSPQLVAVANLAVRPSFPASNINLLATLPVGTMPSAVAINTATGIAVVTNRNTHSVTLIDLTTPAPTVIGFICTGLDLATLSLIEPTTCPVAGPVSVAVDNLRNMALVANSGTSTDTCSAATGCSVAVVSLATQSVTSIIQSGATSIADVPAAIGINPLTGLAIVAYQTAGIASIVDLKLTPPSVTSQVTVSTGATPRVAVSPKLNWALITPGGAGTLTIVDLGRASPVATASISLSVTGVAFNDETQEAILVDPTGPPGTMFSALDQTFRNVTGFPGSPPIGNMGAAFNPLANMAVTVNKTDDSASVIDPATPTVLETFIVGTDPVDVAIDPGTNTAVIVNQGSNNVSIFSLSAMRSPQVLQISPDQVEITSTLTAPDVPTDQTLTIIGYRFDIGTPVVRLDGVPLVTTVVSPRQLTAVVPVAMLTAGPLRYALDVANGTDISNAASFTVIQSVNLTGVCGSAPAPQGVAIDSRRNLAVVSNAGCNSVAIINLATGTGQTVLVGTNPQGVAVHAQSGLAVVANLGSNNASIVDLSGNTVVATVSTDPGPTGVAIDPGLGLALVTASNANVVNMFAVSTSPGAVTSLAVQQRPVAIAIDPTRHLAAVANTTSNSVSLVDLTQSAATEHIAASGLPAGIAFDPVSATFLVAASLNNRVLILDPASRSTSALRVGINPTSIAYNFASSTLVTTNSSSQTMTVVDFLEGRVRAVLSVRPSGQFAVDIHPFSNLAVIADSAGNRVVLLPLPR